MNKLVDKLGRVHDYLRISLTDKCNLNCFYCNPKDSKTRFLKNSALMNNDEVLFLVKLFVAGLGVKKIRFTGGEPLMRPGLEQLFERLFHFKKENPFQLALTSNGTNLYKNLESLKNLGLDRINISLDTLNREKFRKITGYDLFHEVMKSVDKAEDLGYDPVKINTVIIKGVNDDEISDFAAFARDRNINIRFIEFMPFSNNNWSDKGLITYKEIKEIIEREYGLELIDDDRHSVAKDYKMKGFRGKVSFISSISDHFCHNCNRLRISAEGKMKLCLFTNGKPALDILSILRNEDLSNDEISSMISNALQAKKEKHVSAGEILEYNNNEMSKLGG